MIELKGLVEDALARELYQSPPRRHPDREVAQVKRWGRDGGLIK